MAGVWILAEYVEQSKELLNVGRELAGQVGVELAAWTWNPDWADECLAHGADEVFLLPPLGLDQGLDAYIPIIAEKAKAISPEIILVSSTLKGKELAARLAGRLDAGMASECQGLRWDGEKNSLLAERLLYGGAGVQTISCLGRPQIATVPPRTYESAPRSEAKSGRLTEISEPPSSQVAILERKAREHQAQDITRARAVVCVGRGMENKPDLEKARELAGLIGGEVGCTRPIAEELHWMPEDTCIGLSGKIIKPDLYIGLGVSGQIQHLIGTRDARVVCAVNTDENAPIFAGADYGIVGDLNEILPMLLEEIRAVKR
jgi:Electron transfer flavoprotein, alpha subunit